MKKNTKECNIFISISPFQIISVKNILDTNKHVNLFADNYWFIFYNYDIDISAPNCNTRILNNSTYRNLLHALLVFSKQIKRIKQKYINISVYICHPFHIPTNYLLFLLNPDHRYMIPDGALNYCGCKVQIKDLMFMFVKSFIGCLLGIPYKPYTGDITAHDQITYDAIYTFNPIGLFHTSGNIINIKTNPPEKTNDTNNTRRVALIADQNIEIILKNNDAVKVRMALMNYVKNGCFDIVYYKKHPSTVKKRVFFDDSFMKILDSPLPAELLISELEITHVVSFFSTILITVQDMFSNITPVSVGLNIIAERNEEYSRLQKFFKERHVKLIDT